MNSDSKLYQIYTILTNINLSNGLPKKFNHKSLGHLLTVYNKEFKVISKFQIGGPKPTKFDTSIKDEDVFSLSAELPIYINDKGIPFKGSLEKVLSEVTTYFNRVTI